MKHIKTVRSLIFSIAVVTVSFAETDSAHVNLSRIRIPQLTETPEQREARIQWFRDAKFGLFIHWGPAAVSGQEISWGMMDRIEGGASHQKVPRDVYMNLFRDFNPVQFDPDDIMALAKKAGMKYSVFVTKHHDGFSLWHTGQKHFAQDSGFPVHYSIADTPYKKDIVKMVRDAALKHGLKVGWYYSTRDWTHPEYLQDDNSDYNAYYENQVMELLNDYGPVDILWFDHCFGKWNQYTIPQLYRKMYACRPDLLVNNRAARGLPDIPGEFLPLKHGDYDTPENRMGSFQHGRAWESCMILSPHPDHGGWSYRPDAVTRSLTETIRLLSSCVTGDGNMLLNIAPLPDGSIRPEERAVLEGIAPWMEQNGEAVYGTRGGPWINGSWGGSTWRGRHVYLHVFDPDDEGIILNRLPSNVISVMTLDGEEVPFDQDNEKGTVTVVVPQSVRDPHVSIVKLTMDREIDGVQYGPALAGEADRVIPGTLVFRPEDARIEGRARVKGRGKNAAIIDWRDKSTKISWPLEIDSPGTYTVELVTSATEVDSMLLLSAGKGKRLHATVPVTGDEERFQVMTAGQLTFPNADSLTLVLEPVGHLDWKPIQVREVRMIPVNE
jgi:alpha-L-fucosidase